MQMESMMNPGGPPAHIYNKQQGKKGFVKILVTLPSIYFNLLFLSLGGF